MKAAVLSSALNLSLMDVQDISEPREDEVQVALKSVGVCGSDVHFYKHGRIGNVVVNAPMVLGHEASGEVIKIGDKVTHLKVGDRVCMEPGIPDFHSKETLAGCYNLDPSVRFWATPPIDGCLAEKVNHPAALCFKLPDNVSFDEGAFIEPLAIGLHAATEAHVKPGDTALVLGAGTIGIVTAIAALNAGCAKVILSDLFDEKLAVAQQFDGIVTLNPSRVDMAEFVKQQTYGNGVDIIFDCCGVEAALDIALPLTCAQATVMLIGCPMDKLAIDIVHAQTKELTFKTIYRYRNMYPKAISLLAAKKFDVNTLIGTKFSFERCVEAFEYAASSDNKDVKVMINV
ncbi:NAD(P)-dependent alcohol dehydrogenase [Vibrio sinensis]|uniref:NAD(P)-dependent alcohol dehydrogenase n=1 Tax=Vibrio sinensis TaxID=2302434 RepID=A0A3A6QJ73_9VIBR|nr:NAD(P)-dependent alcohol dehydrogenase [Vibrio sinensis]RJX72880.1 NAD(P)-dependent alcohol dehydrogenase [Vibrio sinensis]